MKNNALKTSLIFLGIILLTLIFRMFVSGHSLFINLDEHNQKADVHCSGNIHAC